MATKMSMIKDMTNPGTAKAFGKYINKVSKGTIMNLHKSVMSGTTSRSQATKMISSGKLRGK